MSIKLICIDMDGTLLKDKQNISIEDKEAIAKAVNKGVHVAITTGRVYNCAKLYADLIGLKTPIIASNGAFIGDINGEIIYKNPLDFNSFRDFLIIAEKYDLFTYFTASFGIISHQELPHDNVYKVLNKTLEDKQKIKLDVINNLREAFDLYPDELLKGVCIANGNNRSLYKAKEELQKLRPNLEIVSSWNDNFEIMRKESSKGNAVKKLADFYGLTRDEVMCIGDSENDLSMIEFAGTGVAMGNAIKSVKDKADYITYSNRDCGVSHAIRKFAL